MPKFAPAHVLSRLGIAGLMLALAGSPASAQMDGSAAAEEDAQPSADPRPTGTTRALEAKNDPKTILDDFEHYVLIDRPDIARAKAQELLDLNMDPQEFVRVVEGSRRGTAQFVRAINRAMMRKELEPTVAKLVMLFESGQKAGARDPQSIEKNIRDLVGTPRQRMFARDRIRAAGEYAMPQLLQALLQRNDMRLAIEVRQLMVEMGRHAVMPLVTALPHLDAAGQQQVVQVLGDIEYTHSVPFLYDLRATTASPDVRAAAEDAIRNIVGVVNDSTSVADRYVDVANSYYQQNPTLTPFENDPYQSWWTYDPGMGLTFQAVDSRVFHEGMAMRLAERALELDAQSQRAVSLWIASNFKREIDAPNLENNPAYPADRRDAMYYAVAAGSGPSQRVLATALDGNDTALARRAIEATEKTAGGGSLWEGLGDRRPLLEALRYSNRRVQVEAALALATAAPRQPFDGSDRVVPILASAIRDADAKFAVVLAGDPERRGSVTSILQSRGYTVLPEATTLSEIEQPLADAPGIDLIVTDLPGQSSERTIQDARSRQKLRATPILVLVPQDSYADLATKYLRDNSVRISRAGLQGAEIGESSDQLVEEATGSAMTKEEAAIYRARSLAALRDLGLSGNPVLNVADAAGPLETALRNAQDATKLFIGEVLAYVPARSSQQALFDAAMDARGQDRVSLLGNVALSAKRTGNQLTERQVTSLVELVKTGEDAEATAAASLMGALNLPNANIVPLILNQRG